MNIQRFLSIDVLRAAALVLMIQVHFVENMSSARDHPLLHEGALRAGSLAAPLFTFVVGISLWIWLRRRATSDVSLSSTYAFVARRAGFIFVLGLLHAWFFWGSNQIFHWDILPVIGASTLIVFALRRAPSPVLACIVGLVILVTPYLREIAGYASHWAGPGGYKYRMAPSDIALGFLVHGYFPLFPWLAMPLAGFMAGKSLTGANPAKPTVVARCALPVIGVLLVMAALVGAQVELPGGISRYMNERSFFRQYPASVTYAVGMIGGMLVSLWALHEILDRERVRVPRLAREFFEQYSRFSLSLYEVHHFVHLVPLFVCGTLFRNDRWGLYGAAMSTTTALVLAAVFILLSFGFQLWVPAPWKKCSIEHLMRSLSSGWDLHGNRSHRWAARATLTVGLLLLATSVLLIRLSDVADYTRHGLIKDPPRAIPVGNNLVAPADGTILYVKRITRDHVPDVVKRGVTVSIRDMIKADPDAAIENGYLIGIYMDTESVHINRAPIGGTFTAQHVFNGPHISMMDMDKAVILTRMVPGLTSLKKWLGKDPFAIEEHGDYILKSARTTEVFQDAEYAPVYVIRIADYWVGNILTWIPEGAEIEKGQKFGMITWGSQTDICFAHLPDMDVQVKVGDYVYAGETILATY